MKLTFLGAAGTVTGSQYLIEDDNKRILVDAGLFQGRKELRERNWAPLPYDPAKLDAILLTHAHIDHSGYIPRLVKEGFRGPVYCTAATQDLCSILLPDSGHLQEEDAASANRHGYSRHETALPLYTQEEAEVALEQFRAVEFGKRYTLKDSLLGFTMHRAGHILGASFIRLDDGMTSVLFGGDIGRLRNPVMKSPAKIQEADYLLVESTYGDRLHNSDDPTEDIYRIVRETAARGGTVVIPAFAVGRTQALLYHIYQLKKDGRLPDIPVFVDSPMAIRATALLSRHPADHRLPPDICTAIDSMTRYTQTTEESKEINSRHNGMPKVIISASGMATGGRILHHLKHYIGDERNTILLAGYQADGTRGDRLAKGEKEISIHGMMWPVRAKIEKLDNMSAHADYEEILTWLENFNAPPRRVFITHGEPAAAAAMKGHIEERFGWDAHVPAHGEMVEL
ncbi:MAG: MBL fold metallo-hydrolase [Bdellovibrionales bacterium]|jgi:metallo-beta-lactamase family protein|nr:MBL fold metallo-hydrolase [Bdellovibrionales bacterium]